MILKTLAACVFAMSFGRFAAKVACTECGAGDSGCQSSAKKSSGGGLNCVHHASCEDPSVCDESAPRLTGPDRWVTTCTCAGAGDSPICGCTWVLFYNSYTGVSWTACFDATLCPGELECKPFT